MMKYAPRLVAFAAALSAATFSAQQVPQIRPLGPVTHVSPPGALGSVTAVRPLPDGRVIVNDLMRRQLLLFDADLSRSTCLADSTAATGRSYGGQFGSLISYRADSSLFIEPESMSMTVIAPDGSVGRVMAVPRPSDAMFLVGGPFGTPGYDAANRLVYRGMGPRVAPARSSAGTSAATLQTYTDSAPIFRVDAATRQRDTLAWVRIPTFTASRTLDAQGRPISLKVVTNPIPIVDVWVLMPDGRVAIVRGSDFHIDWIDPAGQRTATPKIPFAWQRLDDDARQRLADSAQAEANKRQEELRKQSIDNPGTPPPLMDALMRPLGSFISRNSGGSGGRPSTAFVPSQFVMSPGRDLPDYRPAFEVGAAIPDNDGNLWVRTTAPSKYGPIYHVMNGRGKLIERVQLPNGRVIAGFGKGAVYMGVLDEKGARLERARIR